jgi:hypothetical protein
LNIFNDIISWNVRLYSNQMPLDFLLVQGASQSECFPLTVLRSLAQAGKLGRFMCRSSSHWASSKQKAKAFAEDVGDAPPTPLNWRWYAAQRLDGSQFSWIECDGWAIDINSGSIERPVIIQRATDYRQNTGARNVRLVRSVHGPQFSARVAISDGH